MLLLISVTITTPIVQTELAHYATEKINAKFNIHTDIGQIAIGIDGSVLLKKIDVLDEHSNALANIKELETNILDFQKLINGQLYFGKTKLKGVDFHIHTYKNDTISNLDKFIQVFDSGKPSEGKFYMNIENLQLKDGIFSITNDNKENPKVIDFKKINGNVKDLIVKGSDISGKVSGFDVTGFGGLELKNSATDFSMTKTSMRFNNLLFITDGSLLKGKVVMNYKQGGLSDFSNEVNLTVHLDQSTLSTNDVRYFYDKIGKNKILYLKTVASGTLNRFSLGNVVLTDTSGAQIIGDFQFDHLLDPEKELKITTNLDRLNISRENAVSFLPSILENALPKELTKLGILDLRGTMSYTNYQVEANVSAVSTLGAAAAEITMTQLHDPKKATYRGQIVLDDFQIGALLENQKLGTASVDLFIDGKGFDPKELQTVISGNVIAFDFNGYKYTDISIDGNLKLPYYKGFIDSKDPNALLDFDGIIDFTEDIQKYNFKANVEYLNLNALNFIKDSLGIFKGNIELDAKGKNIDDFEGKIAVKNASYTSIKNEFSFEDFELKSHFEEDGSRYIEMNSPDIMEGYIRGKFRINQMEGIIENALGSLYTNFSPNKLDPGQYLDFNFNINSKIVSLFAPNIEISDDTHLEGAINADQGDFLLNFHTPSVDISNNGLRNITINVDNKNLLYNTYITVDSVRLKGYDITDFNFINVTQNDTLFTRTEFKGGKEATDFYNLNLYYTINEKNNSVVGFKKSEVSFKDFIWYINEKEDKKNRVIFNKSIKDFEVENIEISHEEQFVLLNGILKDDDYKDLKLNFEKVDLNKITPDLSNLSLGGLIDGEIAFEQRGQIFRPTSNITIDQLEVNHVNLGVFNFDVEGDETLQNFRVKSSIENNMAESFFMNGNVNINQGKTKLNLDVGFDKFDLASIAPFLSSIMSDVRGHATGRMTVGGTHTDPTVDGRLYLNQAGMRPVFTGADYVFDDNAPLDVTEKQFILRSLNITDSKYNTKGILNGTISHDKFQNWNLDVTLSSDNLLALDQKYQEGIPYYGIAFIDGKATIKGPAESLNINIAATSKPGTKISIPLNESGGVGDNNFIHFLTEEEKRNREKGIATTEIANQFGGIQLNFEFVMTPDAEIEVLLDRDTGHGMRGKGAGFITMEINTLGRFNMWGDFQVYEGVYNFKYDVIIDKRLEVKRYGTIRWDGDPLNALLDLEAVYRTEANPGLIVESSAINRKIDTDVSISITGNLTNPEIDFGIDFPTVTSAIKSEIEYKLADRDVRQTQAMALLATGTFITDLNADTAVYGSLLERASSLFDDLFSDEDSKFRVGLNYSQSNRNPFEETTDAARVGVTLSTRVSDRIMINGKLGVPIGGAEDNVIIGDVEVQLLLNEDGSLRARVFNRENNINYLGEGIGYTQGVGLTYEVDFDTFKELLKKIFISAKKRQELKKAKESKNPNTNDIPDDDYGIKFMSYQKIRNEDLQSGNK